MGRPTDIITTLEQSLKSVRKGRLFRRMRVFIEWPNIVGELNARMTRPVALRAGILMVKSESSAWCDRLRYMEEDLLNKIAEHIGAGHVRQIRFITGQLDSYRRAAKTPSELAPPADMTAIDQALTQPSIDGKEELKEDLRNLLKTLQSRNESRKRQAGT
jgi:Dna[CI] antecedent, DciA